MLRMPPPRLPRAARRNAMLLMLAVTLAGCGSREEIEAVIAQTDAFCAAHPAGAWPAPVESEALYVAAGVPMQSWHVWIPARLLQGGFAEIESDASIAPTIAGSGRFLGFRVAPASDPGCAGQAAFAAAVGPGAWESTRRHWIDMGLRPDQCIAIERKASRRSAFWLEGWNASAQMPPLDRHLPIQRERTRLVLREAATGRPRHELVTEHGFVTAGMSVPFGCLRRAERERFTDTLVVGRRAAAPRGPEIVDAPAVPPTLRTAPVAERVRDLQRVRIDGMQLSRRQRPGTESIPGFDLLLGDGHDREAVHPDWPRYLQLVHAGGFRRVRLPWLEGEPHGGHERPLRLMDLGTRVGVLAVTRRVQPGHGNGVDLSWAEFDRVDGLPRLRADAVVTVAIDPGRDGPVLVEDVQRTGSGLRFRVTEVAVDRSDEGGDFLLSRETVWFWPLPANG